MPDRNLIYKKLEEMVKQLKNLKSLERRSKSRFVFEEMEQLFAERVMERLISAAIDINMHIISDAAGEVPVNYFVSFLELPHHKIMPAAFAKKIAQSSAVRNILAHEYQELDLSKFRGAMKAALKDFPRYIKYIQEFLA